MDLHDGAIQSIYAVVLRLEDCAERLSEPSDEVRAGLDKAMDDLNKVLQDIRSYIFDLRPQVLHGDLEKALDDLVQSVRVNALIDAELEVEGDLNGALTEEQAVPLFHIAQEAVNNVNRHAQATSLRVKVTAQSRSVRLEIVDNGVGFDLEGGKASDGHGLRNMDDRARSLGAHLSLESSPGRGTRVRVELPLADVRQ
jgi:two-component system NarL family sensor kinase